MRGFRPPTSVAEIPTVDEMVQSMDAKVAGLKEVKSHLAWVMRRFMIAAVLDRPWRPSNVLIGGPTGGGKTYLLTTLLSSIPVVWAEASATEYSDVGWTGRDLATMYLGLTEAGKRETDDDGHAVAAALHRQRAEQWGVMLIDEFDKLQYDFSGGPTNDRSTQKAIQNELLKFVEGAEIMVGEKNAFMFHTHRVLHIAVGAFNGLNRIVARDLAQPENEHSYMDASLENLIHYGFRDELIGRFATFITLPILTAADHARILEEQLLPAYVQQAADDGIELVITRDAMYSIGTVAQTQKVGARALGPILDAKLRNVWAKATAGDQIILDGAEARLEHRTAAA